MSRSRRNRRRRRATFSPSTIVLTGIASLAAILLLLLFITRPGVAHSVGGAVMASFGQTDYSKKDSDKVLLLCSLNNSWSAAKKQDKETNSARMLQVTKLVADIAGKTVSTRVRVFAHEPLLIYTANSDPTALKRVLKKHYVQQVPPNHPGTDLARVLSEARDDHQEFSQKAGGALAVYVISTDGAAEDIPGKNETLALHKIAQQMAGERVLVFVHGIRPKDRLREQTLDALAPLLKAGKLFHCNETDFDYVIQRFNERLQQELGVRP